MILNEAKERLIDERIASFKIIINQIQEQIECLEKKRMPKCSHQIDLFDTNITKK
jgi:hypothetical protein